MKTLALLLLLSTAAFAKDHDFRTAKLINVDTLESLDEGTTFRRAVFTLQIDDLVYTLKGERIRHSTKDYAEGLVIGDDIKADVEGNDVYLLKPDGKTLKTSVMKRERTTKSSAQ